MLKKGWSILRIVYWYNSLPWRFLKSGGLIVLGFFCLSGGNLVLSYKPHWSFLNYVISYGFLLIVYGPFHHLVVIPLSLRLAHTNPGRTFGLGKRIPFWTLILFFVATGVFGYWTPNPMLFEFKGTSLSSTPDVNPEISCYRFEERAESVIHCSLPTVESVERVEVENDDKRLLVVEDSPCEFELRVSELTEVVGQRNFHVILRDRNGSMIRRYVRSVDLVEARSSPAHTAP